MQEEEDQKLAFYLQQKEIARAKKKADRDNCESGEEDDDGHDSEDGEEDYGQTKKDKQKNSGFWNFKSKSSKKESEDQ